MKGEMMAIGITLTGADERTPLDQLIRLADMGAEIGLLCTFSPEGRNRYPRLGWILDAAKALAGRAAIHFCGKRTRASLMRGECYMLDDVKRFQVNGHLEPREVRILCEGLPGHTVITQHTAANAILAEVDVPNHALLVDASGGRAKLPQDWSRPEAEKSVGFAGGLGPTTLRKELPKIATVARGDWWIDMEGRLRDSDDWFNVESALQVMSIFRCWLSLDDVSRRGQ